MPGATLDHIVVDTRDQIDRAAAAYTSLGFQLTPRGHHTLGSSNNLAIFGTNYLELLGFGSGGVSRLELASFPQGLNGLVFKTTDAAETARTAQARSIPATEAASFSRPVTFGDRTEDAQFRTTRLPPETSGIGRVYFCEHLTPELVWRPEWQAHPNGAQEITRVLVATDDPERQTKIFTSLFEADAVRKGPHGSDLQMTTGKVELRPVAEILSSLGNAAPDPAGRSDFLAGFVLRVADLATVTRLLAQLPGLIADSRRVIVPAAAAFNTTIIFEASDAG